MHTLPSSVHAVPADLTTSAGQLVLEPVHKSWMSHSFAAARQTAPALPAGCWQVTLVPLHWSSVQGFESAVHAVPFVFFASAGQTWPTTPVQFSARSHSPAALRQVNVFGCTTSAGHVLLEPVHVSSGSQTSPEPVRQTVPAFPGGCWQRLLEPLQVSVVHGLPSSVHAVPFGFFASAGQVAPGTPVQFSARSHSPPAARQVKLLDCTTSAGQLVLDPVHVSVGSQASPEPVRQTVPAVAAVVCVQALLLPLHWSTLQGLPSEEHAVPAVFFASAGQVAAVPLQTSARSHSSAAPRHVVLDVKNLQFEPQHTLPAMPVSQSSPAADSTVPLPQSEVKLTVMKCPSLDCVRLGFPG